MNNPSVLKKSHSLAVLICAGFFLAFSYVLFAKYYYFGYYDWDLAFFTQACWKLVRGEQFVPLVGINYFGDHSYFITFLILPIFYVFQSPLTLLTLKVLAFVVAGFLLYRIAEPQLGSKASTVVMILYFLFPGNLFGLLYEFNPEAFAPPFIFLTYIALKKNDLRSFLLWAFVLMSIKENMFLIGIPFGILGLITAPRQQRLFWVSFILLFSALFLYLTFKWIPDLRGIGHHAFLVRYAELGSNAVEILLSPFLRPVVFFSILFHQLNGEYLLSLFSYLLIPALFSPAILILMFPLLLQHLISLHGPEHTIYYHYVPTMAPFIFLAFTFSAIKIKHMCKKTWILRSLLCLFLLLALLCGVFYREDLMNKSKGGGARNASELWEVIGLIPKDAPVVATFNFLAALSTRQELYSFHMLYADDFQDSASIKLSELNTKKAFVLPEHVHYALIDLEDAWIQLYFFSGSKAEKDRLKAFLDDPSWRTIASSGKTLLLAR